MTYPFIQCNAENFKPGRSSPVKYIVVHYTSNNGDTAKGNATYFSGNVVRASANFFVDENEVYLSVSEQDTAWHCGTTGAYKHPDCRNTNSIGVELCSRRDGAGKYFFTDETVNNAVELVKSLMAKYKVPIDNVIRHFDVTGKNCPAPFVQDEKKWQAFKDKLEEKEMQVTYTKIQLPNGKILTIPGCVADGSTFLQIRPILEGLGFKVGWADGKITIAK